MQNFNTEVLFGNVTAQLDCFGLSELFVKRVSGKRSTAGACCLKILLVWCSVVEFHL